MHAGGAALGFATEHEREGEVGEAERNQRLGSILREGKTAHLFIQTIVACLWQNTASAVRSRDRDASLMFINGFCKGNLCSIINRLPNTTKTLRLSCYLP